MNERVQAGDIFEQPHVPFDGRLQVGRVKIGGGNLAIVNGWVLAGKDGRFGLFERVAALGQFGQGEGQQG